MVITLGKKEITLVLPPSFAARHEICVAAAKSAPRAFGAALGLCGVGARFKIPYTYDPIEYGGKIIDALIGSGLTMEQISEAGGIAWNFVAKATIDMNEVEAVEGFTEPPPGA